MGLIGVSFRYLSPKGSISGQGSALMLSAGVIGGLIGLLATWWLHNTAQGRTPAKWFGIVGTRAEFVFIYSLAVLVGSLTELVWLAVK